MYAIEERQRAYTVASAAARTNDRCDEGDTNPPDTAARATAVKATAVEDTAARATMTTQIKTITVQL